MKAPFFQTIQAFLTNLVTKRQKRAIELQLSPCCPLTITDISFTCTATGVATVTVTLDEGVTFPSAITATLSANDSTGDNVSVSYTSGSKTIVFTGFHLTNSTTGVTYTLGLFFKSNMDSNISIGTFIITTATKDNPLCS